MNAALTISVLFTFSFIVVRIAGVAMRITGLADNVARFQCISALTGTGFTTSESEMIVNYPIRRRIVVGLMILGNLGLASTAATLIVSFDSVEPNSGALATQALLFVVAIAGTLGVMLSRPVDSLLCSLIARVLRRTTSLGKRRYLRLLQLGDGYGITEHVFRGEISVAADELLLAHGELILLAIQREGRLQSGLSTATTIAPMDVLICYGADHEHESLDKAIHAQPTPTSA